MLQSGPHRRVHPPEDAAPPRQILPDDRSSAGWFFLGCRGVFCIPALVLMAAFVGFAGFVRELGIPVEQAIAASMLVWALPNMVMLASALSAGTSLPAACLLVTLTAVRLMPLVVTLMPMLATRETKRWKLYAVSHFVAVTSWIYANSRLPSIPRHRRLTYFSGFACTLAFVNTSALTISYLLIGKLPTEIAAALFLLTPVYFLLSLTTAARSASDRLGLLAGLVLGPLLYMFVPSLDLVLTGLVGGTLAYLAPRMAARRAGRGSPPRGA